MNMTRFISMIALVLILLPCLLYCFGMVQLPTTQAIVLAGTIVWFCATPFWMGRSTASE